MRPLVIEGDVDVHTGDISSPGDVVIKGDVRSGLSVEAQGTVTVQGIVEACAILAGGDVQVEHGVLGRGSGEVRSDGRIRVGHVRDATLDAQAGITIGSSAMNSTLVSGQDVQLEGDGVLVGGLVMAKGSLFARSVGHKGVDVWHKEEGRTRRGVEKTLVMLGVDPRVRQRHQRSELCLRLAEEMASSSAKNIQYLLESKVLGASQSILEEIEFLTKLPVSASLLSTQGLKAASQANEKLQLAVAEIALALPSPSDQKETEDAKLRELGLQCYHLFVANELVMDYYDKIRQVLDGPDINLGAVLEASEIVHPGVEVTIGFCTLAVEQQMDGAVFRLLDNKILAQPWSETVRETERDERD